jgi:hypothetical protein
MKLTLLIIYLASILFSVLAAFIYRKHLESRKLLIMLPFLFLVFIQEAILGILAMYSKSSGNSIIYNIYRPATVIVFGFIYYRLPFMESVKRLIVIIVSLYLLLVLSNHIFLESILDTGTYMILVRGFFITFLCLLFLARYFHLDNLSEEKYWRPLLWVTIAIAIFYPVTSISISFQKYLSHGDYTLYGFKLYHVIPRVMSIFMYSCFSYAFFLCRKRS